MDYPAPLLDHFEHPRNLGDLDPCDAAATVRDARGRDWLRLSFRLKRGRVDAVRFRARGCPVAIAAGSAATCLLAGRTIREALRLTDDDVIAALGGLPSARQRRSVLAARAVRAALASHAR